MKKTKIIKIISQTNDNYQSYNATIIVPHNELALNLKTMDTLQKMLKSLLLKPKNLLNKHENKLITYIKNYPLTNEYFVKRSFNLLVDDLSIKITDFTPCEIKYNEITEKQMFQQYLDDYIKILDLIKSRNFYSKLIFNYKISTTE